MDNFETVLPRLRKISLFTEFSEDNERNNRILKAVYNNIQIKEFSKGDVIIKEGDFGDDFFILYNGSVLIERSTPAGDTLALARLTSDMNVFFGETALISNDARTATVKAAVPCKTIVLTKKILKKSAMKNLFLVIRLYWKLPEEWLLQSKQQTVTKLLYMKPCLTK
jgi:CRP-like cAMP-binding protein